MIHLFKKKFIRDQEVFVTPVESANDTDPGNDDFSAAEFLKRLYNNEVPLEKFAGKVLSALANEMEIFQAIFLVMKDISKDPRLKFLAGFACLDEIQEEEFSIGEGLPGQVASDGRLLRLDEVPKGYMTIRTGLGEASPNSLIIFPVKYGKEILGVVEIASFRKFTEEEEQFLCDLSEELGGYLKHFHINGYINPGNEA